MIANPPSKPHGSESQVTTACGSDIRFASETPYSTYKGQLVFFCLPACKEDFDRDPQASCFAVQMALGEAEK